MSLRQAPRFQAWFSHLEGREVMVMPRQQWDQAIQLREGEIAQLDLSTTPIANVARDSRIEAAVVVRTSPLEIVVGVCGNGWPSTRSRRVLAALRRIGWMVKRQSGSDRTLSRSGWADFVFAFHDDEEVGLRMLSRIAKRTGLRPEDL